MTLAPETLAESRRRRPPSAPAPAAARRPRHRLRPGRPRRSRPGPSPWSRGRRAPGGPACCSRSRAGWCPDASSRPRRPGPPAPGAADGRAARGRRWPASPGSTSSTTPSPSAHHVRERLAWLSPVVPPAAPRADQAVVDRVLAPVFGDLPVPDVETVVWHLDEVDALLLRIALAMAQRPGCSSSTTSTRCTTAPAAASSGTGSTRSPPTGVTVVASCADRRRGRRHPLDRPARLRPHPLKDRHALAHLRHRAAPVRPRPAPPARRRRDAAGPAPVRRALPLGVLEPDRAPGRDARRPGERRRRRRRATAPRVTAGPGPHRRAHRRRRARLGASPTPPTRPRACATATTTSR